MYEKNPHLVSLAKSFRISAKYMNSSIDNRNNKMLSNKDTLSSISDISTDRNIFHIIGTKIHFSSRQVSGRLFSDRMVSIIRFSDDTDMVSIIRFSDDLVSCNANKFSMFSDELVSGNTNRNRFSDELWETVISEASLRACISTRPLKKLLYRHFSLKSVESFSKPVTF